MSVYRTIGLLVYDVYSGVKINKRYFDLNTVAQLKTFLDVTIKYSISVVQN